MIKCNHQTIINTTLKLHCRHLYHYHHEHSQYQDEQVLGMVVELLTFHQHVIISVLLVFENNSINLAISVEIMVGSPESNL